MDTMSYNPMLSMVDLISKWALMAFGGMECPNGGLDLIVIRDNHVGMHTMKKMYIVHTS